MLIVSLVCLIATWASSASGLTAIPPMTPAQTPACRVVTPTPTVDQGDCPGAIVKFASLQDAKLFADLISGEIRPPVQIYPNLDGLVFVRSHSAATVRELFGPRGEAPLVFPNHSIEVDDVSDPLTESNAPADPKPAAANPEPVGTASDRPIVIVVDTGVDVGSIDASLLWHNSQELGGAEGVDDDLNGYEDDVNGFNVVDKSNDLGTDSSHGQSVATILVDHINAWADPGAAVKPAVAFCKYGGGKGGCLDGLIGCLDYVEAVAKLHPVVVANLSLGTPIGSVPLAAALNEIGDRGVSTVAAAGSLEGGRNLDSPKFAYYPASFRRRDVVTVRGAGSPSGVGNSGVRTIDLAADGLATSYAAPVAAAAVVLAAAEMPQLTGGQRRKLLLTSGEPLSGTARTVTHRKVSWRGQGGIGMASCAGQRVEAPLLPTVWAGSASFFLNETVRFEAFAAACESDAGPVSVEIWNGEALENELSLCDGSACPGDQRGGDGVFTADWLPGAAGVYTARYRFASGATSEVVLRICDP